MRPGHIGRLEKGRYQPSVELLRKLAIEFGVTADFLLNEAEREFRPVRLEDQRLAQRIELLECLDPEEKTAVIKIIDGLTTKKKFLDLVAQETSAAMR